MAPSPITTQPQPGSATAFTHKGFRVPDPFAPRQRPAASFVTALLATALFRCWHILLFFAAWSTLITVLNQQGHNLTIPSLLLTVVGTVLGFVISYRTTSSFERYNEGRRLWSQIIYACRTFARTVWFHIPEPTNDKELCRSMIEKKTVINLLEAYSVSVKHYLRGEDGIYYQDLYYLVKFLPAYALPPGLPSNIDLSQIDSRTSPPSSPTAATAGNQRRRAESLRPSDASPSFLYQRTGTGLARASDSHLPMPVTTEISKKASFAADSTGGDREKERIILQRTDEALLLPAHSPPKYHILDLFPFALLVRFLTKRGKELKGKKAARLRAKMRDAAISHNLPLEISLYLSSYIAALQARKSTDVPTTNTLLTSLNMLVDSLTGLERILTTPIPFSYSIHLWVVTLIYCFFLPFQIWSQMNWITIPGTVIISFMFFGFLVAGEEIENPFGYDKNDLNLDHFTNNIIRNELRAITSAPPPNPSQWAFAAENDVLFTFPQAERVTPEDWIRRGYTQMQAALASPGV